MSTHSQPSAAASTVVVTRQFAAPPEVVFDAWLDPAVAGRFLFATPTGQMTRVEIEPHVGGRFMIAERRPTQSGETIEHAPDQFDVAEHVGEYLELDRPRRIVFSFGLPKYSADVAQVTIDVAPRESSCQLTLTQSVAPEWAEYQDKIREGWSNILAGLAAVLGDC